MTVVGYGAGTDSTAMLVGLWQHHVPVDLILFADPGAEQQRKVNFLFEKAWYAICRNRTTSCRWIFEALYPGTIPKISLRTVTPVRQLPAPAGVYNGAGSPQTR